MKKYFIKLSFDGTLYCGWQIQKGDQKTVQGEISRCLSLLLNDNIVVYGAGRTDTGVHSKVMYGDFSTKVDFNTDDLKRKLNSFLNKDISILGIKEVPTDASARFSAISREYRYFIELGKNPFTERYSWQLKNVNIDLLKMEEASRILLKHNNFQCFTRSGSDVSNYLCNIKQASWEKKGNSIVFTIIANRFLRNMVRAIVGTIVNVGLNKNSLEDFENIINSKNRSLAGESAPAKGLFLWNIEYDQELVIE